MQQQLQAGAVKAAKMGEAMNSFPNMGVPVETYDLDETRKVLSSDIALHINMLLKKWTSESPGKQSNKPMPRRGIPTGVKTMRSYAEIVDLIPSEMADKDIMDYKVGSKKAQARERYSGVSDTLVYLDKSGSMTMGMKYENTTIEKIAFYAASIIARGMYLKKQGAKLVLKFFDVDPHEEIKGWWNLIKACTGIRAGSGTNITSTLKDAMRYKDYEAKNIVIADND